MDRQNLLRGIFEIDRYSAVAAGGLSTVLVRSDGHAVAVRFCTPCEAPGVECSSGGPGGRFAAKKEYTVDLGMLRKAEGRAFEL